MLQVDPGPWSDIQAPEEVGLQHSGKPAVRYGAHSLPLGHLTAQHTPSSAAITWQVDIDRRVCVRLRQAPVLPTATILQDVFDRGRTATWKQPGVLQSVPAVRKRQLTVLTGCSSYTG